MQPFLLGKFNFSSIYIIETKTLHFLLVSGPYMPNAFLFQAPIQFLNRRGIKETLPTWCAPGKEANARAVNHYSNIFPKEVSPELYNAAGSFILHPQVFKSNAAVQAIELLAKLLPHIVPLEDLPKMVDKWKALQAEAIDTSWYQ